MGVDLTRPSFRLVDYIREPMLSLKICRRLRSLSNFRATGTHQALVIDEYGGVQGMVTLYDVSGSYCG